MNIEFLQQAQTDLADIKAYIARDNPAAADRTINRILQSIRYLGDFPYIGRAGVVDGTRELVVLGLPYRAVYRIESASLVILTVLHTSRLYPPAG